MISRRLTHIIASRLSRFPAVALVGPRQTGKTTLAQTFGGRYYDLELEAEQLRLDLEWEEITQSEDMIILDEAQTYPDIFPRIRGAVDRDRKKRGRFLILGSVSPGLMTQVSEFLTGRIAICELRPFNLQEVGLESADDLWLMGGFPDGGILDKKAFPVWQKNYVELLAMRDLPMWGLPALPAVTMKLFRMLAAANGSIWNASMIGKSMGLSYKTINSYMAFLSQAYLVRTIEPFHANVKKRLVKSPKMFIRDTGLLHALMGIVSFENLIVQPWVGFSWEGWIIEQILSCLAACDISHEVFYFRTSDGHELDLLLVMNGAKWGLEIKLTTSPGRKDMDRLKAVSAMVGAEKSVLISRTAKHIESADTISTNIHGFLDMISRSAGSI